MHRDADNHASRSRLTCASFEPVHTSTKLNAARMKSVLRKLVPQPWSSTAPDTPSTKVFAAHRALVRNMIIRLQPPSCIFASATECRRRSCQMRSHLEFCCSRIHPRACRRGHTRLPPVKVTARQILAPLMPQDLVPGRLHAVCLRMLAWRLLCTADPQNAKQRKRTSAKRARSPRQQ